MTQRDSQEERLKVFGSPISGGKELNHEGHEVHKGGTRLEFMGFFPLCPLWLKKVFPLKTVDPGFSFPACPD
jgi:hypothetical protein